MLQPDAHQGNWGHRLGGLCGTRLQKLRDAGRAGDGRTPCCPPLPGNISGVPSPDAPPSSSHPSQPPVLCRPNGVPCSHLHICSTLHLTHSRTRGLFFWRPMGLNSTFALHRIQAPEALSHRPAWPPGSVSAYLHKEGHPASLSSGAAHSPQGLPEGPAWHSLPLWTAPVSSSSHLTRESHGKHWKNKTGTVPHA